MFNYNESICHIIFHDEGSRVVGSFPSCNPSQTMALLLPSPYSVYTEQHYSRQRPGKGIKSRKITSAVQGHKFLLK